MLWGGGVVGGGVRVRAFRGRWEGSGFFGLFGRRTAVCGGCVGATAVWGGGWGEVMCTWVVVGVLFCGRVSACVEVSCKCGCR